MNRPISYHAIDQPSLILVSTNKNTTNTKHHEAHWTGFEPKSTTKRETHTHKKNKSKQEQKIAFQEFNPTPPDTTAVPLAVLLFGTIKYTTKGHVAKKKQKHHKHKTPRSALDGI